MEKILRPVSGTLTVSIVSGEELPSVASSAGLSFKKQSPFVEVEPQWVQDGADLYGGDNPIVLWDGQKKGKRHSLPAKEGGRAPEWEEKA